MLAHNENTDSVSRTEKPSIKLTCRFLLPPFSLSLMVIPKVIYTLKKANFLAHAFGRPYIDQQLLLFLRSHRNNNYCFKFRHRYISYSSDIYGDVTFWLISHCLRKSTQMLAILQDKGRLLQPFTALSFVSTFLILYGSYFHILKQPYDKS